MTMTDLLPGYRQLVTEYTQTTGQFLITDIQTFLLIAYNALHQSHTTVITNQSLLVCM